jgi:hypothetical protein
MDNAIVWRLGLDRSQITSGLSAVQGDVESASNRIAQGFGRAAEGGGQLFTSSHRVARQIQSLTQDLARGGDSLSLFGAGLEAVERSLRLPLGALAGLAVGAVIVKQLNDVREADEKMKQALATSFNPSGIDDYKASVETLTERIKATIEAAAVMQTRIEKPGTMQRVGDFFSNLFGGGGNLPAIPTTVPGAPVLPRGDHPTDIFRDETNAKIREAQAQNAVRLALEEKKIKEAGVDVEKRIYEVRLAVAEVEKSAAEKSKRPDLQFEAQTKIDGLKAEKEIADLRTRSLAEIQKQASEIASKNRDKLQFTLADLAKEGRRDVGFGGGTGRGVGDEARRAMEEERLARQDALAGNMAEAQRHVERAENIKAGILQLRDSEKDLSGAVRMGVDSAAIFIQLLAATKAISFANR